MFFILLFFLALDRLLKSFFLKNPAVLVKHSGHYWFSSVIIILLTVFILKYKKKLPVLVRHGLALIFVGGLSNFSDRVIFGFVIDYIKISFLPFVFNFSDILITAGCLLVIYPLITIKSPAN
ncbi:hypothetical protein COS55_01690 [Candidatus Shapirobacteria bacterium CG03_land_8_20_14_0_80_40_19]|uniref:Uncharacterized protein n=4 Tax=Candidatus Shapironibacteriota TaxID=1752721 RepID=A0A2M7BEH7_9BACT|nr:MAG: hypothetical protein COV89_00750 [Candidatus Shapirobacteria bacterium CG11_big_fil_rev_8_21_14_0_20_40_12]PIV01506.1 MAG: hypothetical protein COS55_01690 [Candidatus Shapirobacteria bacterium CG03_land_8_20_14_0_80_40_19]PJC28933.1 MAG: hypothetical protein CO053_02005 [Candidatus Shapirobacteria bacterium CG_4_9_14_0_2_um_filter_40_11]PJC76035.1 MAG: hypothetical protein CO010_03805 [Candidatus Shapirobacteria bacterium CG_4_8_14_3_um_filter_39_11]